MAFAVRSRAYPVRFDTLKSQISAVANLSEVSLVYLYTPSFTIVY